VPANCTPWCPTHPACPPFVLTSSTKLGVFIRNYLEPSTDVGPSDDPRRPGPGSSRFVVA